MAEHPSDKPMIRCPRQRWTFKNDGVMQLHMTCDWTVVDGRGGVWAASVATTGADLYSFEHPDDPDLDLMRHVYVDVAGLDPDDISVVDLMWACEIVLARTDSAGAHGNTLISGIGLNVCACCGQVSHSDDGTALAG